MNTFSRLFTLICSILAGETDEKYAAQIVWSHLMSFFSLILIVSRHSIRKLSSRKLTRINNFQPLAMGFTKVSIRLQFLLQESISPLKNLWKTAKPSQTKSTNPKHKGSRLSLQSSNTNFITSNFLSHPICKLIFKGDSQVIPKHSQRKPVTQRLTWNIPGFRMKQSVWLLALENPSSLELINKYK